MTVTEGNIEQFKAEWRRAGVDTVLVKSFCSFAGENEDIKKLTPIKTEYVWRLCNVSKKEKSILKYLQLPQCPWPWRNVVVLWDGRVVPCCFDYDALYVLGDLKEKSLSEIWNDKPALELRKQCINYSLEDNRLCATCTFRRSGMNAIA